MRMLLLIYNNIIPTIISITNMIMSIINDMVMMIMIKSI